MKKLYLVISLALMGFAVNGSAADPIDDEAVKRSRVEIPPAPTEEPAEAPVEVVEVVAERWSAEVVDIARACVNEAGLLQERRRTGERIFDCGAMVQVARWHAARNPYYQGSLSRAIRRLSRRSFDRTRTDGNRWVPWMGTDLAQPRGWGSNTWNPALWEARLDEVAAHVAGTAANPCPEDVFHWGGPVVDAARIERGIARRFWRPVDCGGTLNTFLAPRTVPASVARGNPEGTP